VCNISHEKLFTPNVTNVTFIFETSLKTKPKGEKCRGTWHILSPPSEKVGGQVPLVPHLIALIAGAKAILDSWSRS